MFTYYSSMKWVFLCLLFSCSVWAQMPALKVLTLNFNSELVPSDGDYKIRDARFARMQKWVHDNDPDIIFFQEAWSYRHDKTIAQSLARAIGYDLCYHIEMGVYKFFFEGEAVLVKKNLKLDRRFAIKLPHSAFELGARGWVIELGSVSFAVGGRIEGVPFPLYVYSVHFGGSTDGERGDQARAIIGDAKARAQKDGLPWDQVNVIIAGDFNSISSEQAPQAFLHEGFRDTYDVAHPGVSPCTLCEAPEDKAFNPYTIGAGQIPPQESESAVARIDYVFSRGPNLNVASSTIMFTFPENGIWMSDHYGVKTVFSSETGRTDNLFRDSSSEPLAAIFKVTSEMVNTQVPPQSIVVNGGRGVAFQNRSGYPVRVSVKSVKGGRIYISPTAYLFNNEQTAFTFSAPGDYEFQVVGLTWTSTFKITGNIRVR